ncbi:MAG: FMN-binding protein [Clostridia bacterium]|nr:FMN-binding protein [Clostridia bacterium]
MKNPFVNSVVVLTSICLIASVVLAVTNMVTAPVIDAAQEDATAQAMKRVLPEAKSFVEVMPDGAAETVKSVNKDTGGKGYVVTLSTKSQYSKSDMQIAVGVSADGKIVDIEITNYAETKDFGEEYPKDYIGKDADTLSSVDNVAGVTFSSSVFKDALNDALEAYTLVSGEEERDENE